MIHSPIFASCQKALKIRRPTAERASRKSQKGQKESKALRTSRLSKQARRDHLKYENNLRSFCLPFHNRRRRRKNSPPQEENRYKFVSKCIRNLDKRNQSFCLQIEILQERLVTPTTETNIWKFWAENNFLGGLTSKFALKLI